MARGQAPASAIPMTDLQRTIFTEQSKRGVTGVRQLERINILLLASRGASNSHVKRTVGVSLNTVKSWRNRWQSAYPKLLLIEQEHQTGNLSLSKYRKELFAVLKDSPRSGSPKRITLAEEQQITALSCDTPEQHGIAVTTWTYELLAQTAVNKGIIDRISPAQTGRILKKKSPTAK